MVNIVKDSLSIPEFSQIPDGFEYVHIPKQAGAGIAVKWLIRTGFRVNFSEHHAHRRELVQRFLFLFFILYRFEMPLDFFPLGPELVDKHFHLFPYLSEFFFKLILMACFLLPGILFALPNFRRLEMPYLPSNIPLLNLRFEQLI